MHFTLYILGIWKLILFCNISLITVIIVISIIYLLVTINNSCVNEQIHDKTFQQKFYFSSQKAVP